MSDARDARPIGRRDFVGGVAGVALGTAGLAAATPNVAAASALGAAERTVYELRTYELRSDIAPARGHAFLERDYVPALRRAGVVGVAAFTPDVGLATQSVLLLVAHAGIAAAAAAADRLAADAALRAASDAWERGPGLPYVRYDVALYRAFAGHPRLEVPPAALGRPPRLFELRTYEAPSDLGLRNKVAMFDTEEITIFRDVGMTPVFFGEAIAGTRLPHLTYMLAFDDLAARSAAWARFGASPAWQRIRTRPGWTDPEAVSSIRAVFLRPTNYSDVR